MKIAIAQISTDPGFIDRNVEKIKTYIYEAEGSADIIVFPELTIPGYIPLDLTLDDQFVSNNIEALDEIIKYTVEKEILVIVGFISMDLDDENLRPDGLHKRYNSLAAIHNGKIIYTRNKILLPSYDIFYEGRYFSQNQEDKSVFFGKPPVFDFEGKKLGLLICEDLWDEHYDTHPIKKLKHSKRFSDGVDLVISINASPFIVNKRDQRLAILERAAKIVSSPIVYVNRVGAIDGYDGEIVFDGASSVVNSKGELILELPSFKECLMNYDTEEEHRPIEVQKKPDEIEQIHDALIEGVREYFRRSGFRKAIIGLSGGIDSAVVAALAVKAVGTENVIGVTMPSKHSSGTTKCAAHELAKNLGIKIHEIPIEEPAKSLIENITNGYNKADSIEFRDKMSQIGLKDLTQQNIQARMRGNYLMTLSNEFGYLLLTTGNKTEMALGYTTLYGDMSGGLAVISDVNKMDVYALARFINEKNGKEIIPKITIEIPPSAELTGGQTDEDSLGAPYVILAPLVDEIVEEGKSFAELSEGGYDPQLVSKIFKMVHRAEYKRRQSPPGIKVTAKTFGIGRRIPMMHGFSG